MKTRTTVPSTQNKTVLPLIKPVFGHFSSSAKQTQKSSCDFNSQKSTPSVLVRDLCRSPGRRKKKKNLRWSCEKSCYYSPILTSLLVCEDEKIIFVLRSVSPKQLCSLERSVSTDNQSFAWILRAVGGKHCRAEGRIKGSCHPFKSFDGGNCGVGSSFFSSGVKSRLQKKQHMPTVDAFTQSASGSDHSGERNPTLIILKSFSLSLKF